MRSISPTTVCSRKRATSIPLVARRLLGDANYDPQFPYAYGLTY